MTMTSSTGHRPTRAPRQKGWYIPWIFVGLFLVVAAVNGVMIHFAFSSWTGLQTEEHFLKGIKYNQDLAGAAPRPSAVGRSTPISPAPNR